LSCSAGDDASAELPGSSPAVGPSGAGATSRRLSLRSPVAAAATATGGGGGGGAVGRPNAGPGSCPDREHEHQEHTAHASGGQHIEQQQQLQQQQGQQFGSGSRVRWWGSPVPPPSPSNAAAGHVVAATHRTYYQGFVLSAALPQLALANPRPPRSPASCSNPSHNNNYSPGIASSSRGNGSGGSSRDGSGSRGGGGGLLAGEVVVRVGDGVLLSPLPGEVVSQVVRIEQLWQEVPSDGRPRLLARCRRFYRPQVRGQHMWMGKGVTGEVRGRSSRNGLGQALLSLLQVGPSSHVKASIKVSQRQLFCRH
jgi:hypothetical protein